MKQMLYTVLIGALLLCDASATFADEFDYYINTVLEKVPDASEAKKLAMLTSDLLFEHSNVLKGIPEAFVVVRTNGGRWSKLLAIPARQKVSDGKSLPILLVSRFVTYREGEDQTVEAKDANVRLFAGFRFNLDIGQVVPEEAGGDLETLENDGNISVRPVGKAELYLITKPLPQAKPVASPNVQIGEMFEPRYFNGVYTLFEDGRREGTLQLKVDEKEKVAGWYYSGKDGKKYEVTGQIGNPKHAIEFQIMFPRTLQKFRGLMFTADDRAIAGIAQMQNWETGFYALRKQSD